MTRSGERRRTTKRVPVVRPPASAVGWVDVASHGVPVTLGSAAATDWLRAQDLTPSNDWFVEVALDVIDAPARQVWSGVTDSRFHIHVYPQEWGFLFCHGSRASWIRVGERPFVHGRDDYELVGLVPLLRDLGPFLRMLEQRHRVTFRREHALIRSNLPGAEAAVRGWLATL